MTIRTTRTLCRQHYDERPCKRCVGSFGFDLAGAPSGWLCRERYTERQVRQVERTLGHAVTFCDATIPAGARGPNRRRSLRGWTGKSYDLSDHHEIRHRLDEIQEDMVQAAEDGRTVVILSIDTDTPHPDVLLRITGAVERALAP